MPEVSNETYERCLQEASFDSCYATWIQRVDQICGRFLDVSFIDLELEAFEARDYFDACMKPETYFKDVLVPAFELDYGCDFVEELIADNAMWGGEKP